MSREKIANECLSNGIAQHMRGELKEAINSYDLAIELDPRNSTAYSKNGSVLSSLGRKEEAIKYYDIAIELNPLDSLTYNNKGNALYS